MIPDITLASYINKTSNRNGIVLTRSSNEQNNIKDSIKVITIAEKVKKYKK